MSTNAKEYLEKITGKITLGKAIRSIRQCEEETQTAFAKKLHVSTQYLCDLEHGGKTAYISIMGNVYAVDTTSDAFSHKQAISPNPTNVSVAISADEKNLYTVDLYDGIHQKFISLYNISLARFGIKKENHLNPWFHFNGYGTLLLGHDNQTLYLLDSLGISLSIFDVKKNNFIASHIPLPNGYSGFLLANPLNNTIYISDGANVDLFDTSTYQFTTSIPVGTEPMGMAITPDCKKLYVANRGSNTVSVIDLTTNTVIATLGVGNDPQSVRITADGRTVFVANGLDLSVSLIDTDSNTVTRTIQLSD